MATSSQQGNEQLSPLAEEQQPQTNSQTYQVSNEPAQSQTIAFTLNEPAATSSISGTNG